MRKSTTLFGRVAALAAMIVFAAGCDSSDSPPSDDSGSATGGGDPVALLSSDPVDQINAILARAIVQMPGELYEVRYQIRLIPGDSLAVDFDHREGDEEWVTGATAVTALGANTIEVSSGRNVRLICKEADCVEYRVPLDALDLARLPEGPGRDRFLEILASLSTGEADIDALGGEAEINRLLRESAISFSETVSSWYQVSFSDDGMRMVTWQHAEGFPEHTTPGWRMVHLPGLGAADGSEAIPCRDQDCVLEVKYTRLRFVPPTPEDATRLVELISGLGGARGG